MKTTGVEQGDSLKIPGCMNLGLNEKDLKPESTHAARTSAVEDSAVQVDYEIDDEEVDIDDLI